MLYETWGAIAAIAQMAVDTGGGGYVGGDAHADGDYTGRDRRDDRITFNANFADHHRRLETDEEKLEWLYIVVFGSQRLGVVGLQDQTRHLRNEIILMRIAGAAIVIFLLFLLVAIMIIARSIGL